MPHVDPIHAFLAGAALATLATLALLFRRASDVRADAIEHSRAVIRGQVSEQVLPLSEDFPFEAADARFLGHPVDFVVFDGLASDDEELEVVLVEVKSGSSQLSRRERRIREAVERGRVRFEVLRVA